jgi:hypothetical protein
MTTTTTTTTTTKYPAHLTGPEIQSFSDWQAERIASLRLEAGPSGMRLAPAVFEDQATTQHWLRLEVLEKLRRSRFLSQSTLSVLRRDIGQQRLEQLLARWILELRPSA